MIGRFARVSSAIAGAVAVLLIVGAPSTAAPPPEPAPGNVPEQYDGLVPIPVGCSVPPPTDLVFVGTAVGTDYVDEFIRFEIDQLRAGSASRYAIDGLIDVRYGDDFRFVDEGTQYLIGAAYDPEYGRLSSKVRPTEPLFGGNDVIGLDDTSVECPDIDDPIITVYVDGDPVDSGVLSLLFDDKRLLLATVLVPTGVAFAVLIGLVLLRRVWGWGMHGIFELGRAAVTPEADAKAIRSRRHRDPAP